MPTPTETPFDFAVTTMSTQNTQTLKSKPETKQILSSNPSS